MRPVFSAYTHCHSPPYRLLLDDAVAPQEHHCSLLAEGSGCNAAGASILGKPTKGAGGATSILPSDI